MTNINNDRQAELLNIRYRITIKFDVDCHVKLRMFDINTLTFIFRGNHRDAIFICSRPKNQINGRFIIIRKFGLKIHF